MVQFLIIVHKMFKNGFFILVLALAIHLGEERQWKCEVKVFVFKNVVETWFRGLDCPLFICGVGLNSILIKINVTFV